MLILLFCFYIVLKLVLTLTLSFVEILTNLIWDLSECLSDLRFDLWDKVHYIPWLAVPLFLTISPQGSIESTIMNILGHLHSFSFWKASHLLRHANFIGHSLLVRLVNLACKERPISSIPPCVFGSSWWRWVGFPSCGIILINEK